MNRKKIFTKLIWSCRYCCRSSYLITIRNFARFRKEFDSNQKTLSCSVTNSETAGPFPTITPSSLVRTNIVGDRTGVAFTITLYINNTNANCAAYQGVIVDIWHCDKDGYYSEYGGTSMQTVNYTNNHFLERKTNYRCKRSCKFYKYFSRLVSKSCYSYSCSCI